MAPLQFARLRPSGFRQAFTSAGKRRSAYWLSSLWLLAAFFACLWWDVLTFASSSSATGRSSRSLLQAQQKEWSGAGLLGVARVGQVLANFAPQVSSIVVTSMVLLGVMGAAGSNDGTAGGPDWNTNVQVSVSKQQGTSDDGTAWTRITTTSMRETRVGAPMKELSKLVGSLRTTLDQAEASERLLDELASADSSRAWHLERLLWQTWYFHENPVAMTLLSEGSNLMDEGDLELAKQCFLHAATLEPSWAEAWNRLATVDYLLGNYNYSLKEIDKTLELQPRHFGALSGKGLVYLKLERFQNAIEAFQDAQEVVPTSESLKHNIEYTEALQKEADCFHQSWHRISSFCIGIILGTAVLHAMACIPWTENIILLSDSYKVSHWKQYPPGTEYVYSYFESRGCDNNGWNEVVFFGLQYFIKRYLLGQVVTKEKIDEAAEIYSEHFGDGVNDNPSMFYREGWEYILKEHGGRLPVEIKAVPEGMVVPTKTVLFTLVNTDPKCFWLTNFLETLLVQVWYPMTVATQSRYQKMSIAKYMEETGNTDWSIPNGVTFKLHDFGFRGVSSVESAAIGGCAHLVNFMGTDTVASMICARDYYGSKKAAGGSIPASEHSTITSWGVEGECDAMRNMLESYPEGLVACVSDSFDIWRACKDYWGDKLKDLIKGRITDTKFGRLVVRPDSGDPAETCCSILKILLEQFKEDVTTTPTGHKLLPPYIRVIQGDGVDWESIPKILEKLKKENIAADNIGFGSGGALLQKLNRDTFKCAFKCAEITINGEKRDVFKDPITDKGKASKKGRLTLQLASETTGFTDADKYKPRSDANPVPGGTGCLHYSTDGKFVTVASGRGDPKKDILVDVFKNGSLLVDYTLDEIRKEADIKNGPFGGGKTS